MNDPVEDYNAHTCSQSAHTPVTNLLWIFCEQRKVDQDMKTKDGSVQTCRTDN